MRSSRSWVGGVRASVVTVVSTTLPSPQFREIMTEPTVSPDPDPDPAGTPGDAEHHRSPALIATAVALPVALLIGIVVAAVLANRTPELAPVALGPVVAP
ncbi:membrane protein, partial [Rhodococcus rhodochrous]